MMYNNGRKIIYEKGDRVGPYNIIFIREIEPQGKHRRGKFLCPKCKRHIIKGKLSTVRTGYTKQCSVCRAKRNMEHLAEEQQKRRVDLTNKTFGRLTTLYPTEKRAADRSVVWACVCSCGNLNTIEVSSTHLRSRHTQSCGCLASKGEEKIRKCLSQIQEPYDVQYKFEDCINPRTKALLSFDFYLPQRGILIEYDGKQHYQNKPHGYFTKEKLKEISFRDSIKNQYCKENNIPLIRLLEDDYDKIDNDYLYTIISQYPIKREETDDE